MTFVFTLRNRAVCEYCFVNIVATFCSNTHRILYEQFQKRQKSSKNELK